MSIAERARQIRDERQCGFYDAKAEAIKEDRLSRLLTIEMHLERPGARPIDELLMEVVKLLKEMIE